MTTTIRAEQRLTQPPSRVWRALTDPERLGRWLMPTDFRAEQGAVFHFDTGNWGKTTCAVLVLEPERRLSYSWKNPPLDTVVTYTLTPEGDGTLLVVEHSGFDLEDPRQRFAYDGMRNGWQGIVGRLAGLLADEAQ